jgi:hypothetical protein
MTQGPSDTDEFFAAVDVSPSPRHLWAAWVPIAVLAYGLAFAAFFSLFITFSSFVGDREFAVGVTRVVLYPMGDFILVTSGIAQAFLGYTVSNPTGAIIVAVPTSLLVLPFGVAQASVVAVLVLLVQRVARFGSQLLRKPRQRSR